MEVAGGRVSEPAQREAALLVGVDHGVRGPGHGPLRAPALHDGPTHPNGGRAPRSAPAVSQNESINQSINQSSIEPTINK